MRVIAETKQSKLRSMWIWIYSILEKKAQVYQERKMNPDLQALADPVYNNELYFWSL